MNFRPVLSIKKGFRMSAAEYVAVRPDGKVTALPLRAPAFHAVGCHPHRLRVVRVACVRGLVQAYVAPGGKDRRPTNVLGSALLGKEVEGTFALAGTDLADQLRNATATTEVDRCLISALAAAVQSTPPVSKIAVRTARVANHEFLCELLADSAADQCFCFGSKN